MTQVLFQRVHPDASLPAYASDGASGMDVQSVVEALVTQRPTLVRTGLRLAFLEPGTEIQVRPRSGNTLKKGYTVANTPGTIDADYRGEIQILLVVFGGESVRIRPGDRIAQLVLAPVLRGRLGWTDEVNPTVRGEGGFGSTEPA